MLIGEDYPKIEWDFMGFEFLEPNAFYGDFILFSFGLFFAYKIKHLRKVNPVYNGWYWFFIVFGFGVLFGGLGHLMWNYWGVEGKYLSWYSTMFSSFIVERSMAGIHPNEKSRKILQTLTLVKLVVALSAQTAVILLVDVANNVPIGLMVSLVNTGVGLLIILAPLSIYYQRKKMGEFMYMVLAVAIIVPLVFFQIFKINFHQWFDRNDASHVFLFLMLLFFYLGVKKLSTSYKPTE